MTEQNTDPLVTLMEGIGEGLTKVGQTAIAEIGSVVAAVGGALVEAQRRTFESFDLSGITSQFPAPGLDVASRLASLADISFTFDGAFSGPLPFDLPPEPPRSDLTFTPAEDETMLCPECHEPVSEVYCEGARVDAGTQERDGRLIVDIRATDMLACEYRPCGHRFDGATGRLIGGDDD